MSRRLLEEPKLVIIERPNFRFVLCVACYVSAVLKMFPHERTFIEIADFFRVTGFITVRLIEAGQNCHKVRESVVVHLEAKTNLESPETFNNLVVSSPCYIPLTRTTRSHKDAERCLASLGSN